MEKPIKPKLAQKAAPAPAQPAPLPPPLPATYRRGLMPAKVQQKPSGEADTQELNHLAMLGGLGLLVHISEMGEHLSASQKTIFGSTDAVAVEPRDRLDPRKRMLPR